MSHLLVLTCEHAGNAIPGKWSALFADVKELLSTHRGIDIGALTLAERFAQEWNVPLYQQPISRLLIDCNRSITNRSLFSEYSKKIPKREREELIQNTWLPYRQRVKTVIDAAIEDGLLVIHLSIHTFTPRLHEKTRTTDVGILYDPERGREAKLALLWKTALRESLPHFATHQNKPYKGQSDGFTTALRQELPSNSYIGIELEVNQKFAAVPSEWDALSSLLARSLPLFQFLRDS